MYLVEKAKYTVMSVMQERQEKSVGYLLQTG
jgi:hypothetical protein